MKISIADKSLLLFSQQKGLTLVELMIGMVIAIILLSGVAEIFIGSKQTYRYQAGMARLQENGRFALDSFASDLRMAGYMGCFKTASGSTVNTLNPGAAINFDFTQPVKAWEATNSPKGYEANNDGSVWTTEIPADVRALINSTPAGTEFSDVLVITSMGNEGVRLQQSMPTNSAALQLVNHTPEIMFDEDILFISDCTKSAIFQATNVTYPSGNGSVTVVHNTGGSASPGNAQKNLTNDGSTFGVDASVFSLIQRIYFLAPSTLNNNSNDTVMALWQKTNTAAPVELVAGVSNLQVLKGEDYDGDNTVDRYANANLVDFENVLSVRISLDADTIERINRKTTDQAIRSQSFTQTVNLRNH